jgi:hypothetical protein
MAKSPAEAPPAATGLVVAVADFFSFHQGADRPVPVKCDAIAREDHTVVAANPAMFRPLHVDFDTTTETEDR